MKTTVVPAQVTTVEDRIAGSLGLNQLLLLAAPVFGGSVLYVVLPPVMHSATYKLIVITTLMFVCGLLAIRIKGKLLLFWLVVILRYRLRPRYYVFNKNSQVGRERFEYSKVTDSITETKEIVIAPHREVSLLSTADVSRVLALMENPAANLAFETTKKGGLYVRITEVKEQS